MVQMWSRRASNGRGDEVGITHVRSTHSLRIKTRCPNSDTNLHLTNGRTDSIFTCMVVKILYENVVSAIGMCGKLTCSLLSQRINSTVCIIAR